MDSSRAALSAGDRLILFTDGWIISNLQATPLPDWMQASLTAHAAASLDDLAQDLQNAGQPRRSGRARRTIGR